jgi:CO/xanthine dehydrogenase FAD-binding subunit
MRLPELEARLLGVSPADATRMIAESKPYLTERLEPIGDLLGSAEYKIAITSVLLARALEQAVADRANGGSAHD